MNMFRDLMIAALIILGLGLIFGGPENWTWPDLGGPYVVSATSFLIMSRPYSPLICFVLALALFMTRLKY